MRHSIAPILLSVLCGVRVTVSKGPGKRHLEDRRGSYSILPSFRMYSIVLTVEVFCFFHLFNRYFGYMYDETSEVERYHYHENLCPHGIYTSPCPLGQHFKVNKMAKPRDSNLLIGSRSALSSFWRDSEVNTYVSKLTAFDTTNLPFYSDSYLFVRSSSIHYHTP